MPGPAPCRLGHRWLAASLGALLLVPPLAGCQLVGIAASAVPRYESANYDGLRGQTVGVMVDVDEAVTIDWPELRLDVAAGIQDKLQQAQKGKSKELADAQFPYPPASVVRFQREHPETQGQPVVSIAPRLGGISRLIYLEMEDFQTHPSSSFDLFRGSATVRVKVVEVTNGRGKIGFEDTVRVVFPPNAPEDGIPNANEYAIYRGTVDQLTTEVAKLFITHSVDE